MQSSSNGMLSALGLLACAVVAGMFAAKKWPQGPPRDLPLRARDWLAQQAAPPHAVAHNEARYEGPPPRFNPASTAEGASGPNCFAPPAVEFEEPPSAVEQSAEGQAHPDVVRTLPATGAAPSPVRPASAISRPGESGQINPSRYEPAKPSAFWPSDLADLLPGVGATDPRSPASSRSRASEPGSAGAGTAAESIEQLVRRLEQMGAVVVRLERQRGTSGYVFRCELPLPQNPRYHRFFQAADAEPARAIQRVTRDVEAWKATERR